MIDVSYFYGLHQGGTKEYHLYLFTKAGEKRGLMLKRWGKKGANGQCKVEMSGAQGFDSALNDRIKNGYDMRRQQTSKANSVNDALSILPVAHQRAFSNAQLVCLDDVNYSAGDSSAFDPLANKRAQTVVKDAQAARVDEQKARAEQEKVETDHALQSNSFYGMF